MEKILFSGGGGASTEALWGLLSSEYELYFADADIDAIHPIINGDRRVKIPFANDKPFVAEVSTFCHEKQIDFFVPGVDEELLQLAQQKHLFEKTELFLPDAGFVEIGGHVYHVFIEKK